MAETTADAVSLAPRDAIAFLRQKTNITSEHWTDLWQEAHSRAFTVAGATTDALVEDFRREVTKALEEGTTLAEFRQGFDAIVKKHGWTHTGSPGWRANIIYETNLSMAYSAGRYKEMTDPDVLEAFPYWRYQHNPAIHPREQHLAWDGTTLRASDGWWRTHWPPNGWRCHCSVEPVTDRGLARAGKSGPDQAPPLDMRPWRNPKTGEVVEVPRGVDPGFGYNPGQAWLDGESGGRVARGGAPGRRPLRAESVEPTRPAPTTRPPATSSGAIARFVEQPRGKIVVGELAPELQRALGSETAETILSEQSLEKQGVRHSDVTPAEYENLPAMLQHPDIVAREGDHHLVLFKRAGRLYRAAVKTTQDRSENYVSSFHRTTAKKALRKLRGLELVIGTRELLNDDDESGAPEGPAGNPS